MSSPFTFEGICFVGLTQSDLLEDSNTSYLGLDVAKSLLFLVCLRRIGIFQNYSHIIHFRTHITYPQLQIAQMTPSSQAAYLKL